MQLNQRQSGASGGVSPGQDTDRDSTQGVPSGWPVGPQPLHNSLADTIFDFIYDVTIVALSLVFLVFGLLVKQYDGASVDQHKGLTRGLIEATKYGPTIFPILFAAVVGRALKGLLSWRLERGAELGTLDVLSGSYTLVSTVITQLTLRILSVTGLLLIILWALSPVGGQASLRVMTVGNATTNSTTSFEYVNRRTSFNLFRNADDSTILAVVNGLVVASLLNPNKDLPVDTWNNVKIPMIEPLEAASGPEDDGWYRPSGNQTVYSSLIGIPVSNMTYSDHNSSFSMESFYWHVDCPVLTHFWQPPHTNLSAEPWVTTLGFAGTLASNRSSNSTLCGKAPPPGQKDDVAPRILVFNSYDSLSSKTGSICNIRTSYVETEISCLGTACAVSKMRRSQKSRPTSSWTYLDEHGCSNFLYFSGIFTNLITGHDATPTPIDAYFVDPDDPFNATLTYELNPGLYSLGQDTYAIRFAQLLNTLWTATSALYSISGGLNAETSAKNTAPDGFSNTALTESATGTRSTNVEVIVCHNGWLAALVLSSFAMVAASLAHPIVRFFRKAPDFSVNVSTMIRDNPHVALPSNGSNLDTSQRSRLLKNKRVRFGDVTPYNDVGHLAVGSIDDGGIVAQANKNRLYD